jgi:hypothetical protein
MVKDRGSDSDTFQTIGTFPACSWFRSLHARWQQYRRAMSEPCRFSVIRRLVAVPRRSLGGSWMLDLSVRAWSWECDTILARK